MSRAPRAFERCRVRVNKYRKEMYSSSRVHVPTLEYMYLHVGTRGMHFERPGERHLEISIFCTHTHHSNIHTYMLSDLLYVPVPTNSSSYMAAANKIHVQYMYKYNVHVHVGIPTGGRACSVELYMYFCSQHGWSSVSTLLGSTIWPLLFLQCTGGRR